MAPSPPLPGMDGSVIGGASDPCRFVEFILAPDLGSQNPRGTKPHRFARVDPHLLPSLGVTADARTGEAYVKAAKPSDRNSLSTRERTNNLRDYCFDQRCCVFAREADLSVDRFVQSCASNGCCGHRAFPDVPMVESLGLAIRYHASEGSE